MRSASPVRCAWMPGAVSRCWSSVRRIRWRQRCNRRYNNCSLSNRRGSVWAKFRLEERAMSKMTEIQYVSDAEGNNVGVIVPIELWREIQSERETAYLLRSETMKRRLLKAKE